MVIDYIATVHPESYISIEPFVRKLQDQWGQVNKKVYDKNVL
jgi:hypothetical protein